MDRHRLMDLARRWDSAAAASSRVALTATGSAAAAASARAQVSRECARDLRARLDEMED